MALKPCRECNKKVSTEASTCPSCGVPRPTQTEEKIKHITPKAGPVTAGTFLDFWTGHKGLSETFWLYFIVGNMIGNLMVLGAASEGIGLVYFVIFVTVVWNIFAIMGVFNAADIYKDEKIKVFT